MWGLSDPNVYWGAVMRLYDRENLAGAYALAVKLGEGAAGRGLSVFRLIEAEYEAQRRGVIRSLTHWLSLQYIDDEVGDQIEAMSTALRSLAEAEANRFGWTETVPVQVTLLSQDSDAWWATSRFGYCTEKVPFYKIGIPFHALSSPARFAEVFRHEFAHVISLSLSKGRIAPWLGEGFSVYASGEDLLRAIQVFRSNPRQWLSPKPLNLRFGPGLDLADPAKWLAYQQSGIIAHYLVGLRDERTLVALLRDHADESFWNNARLLLGGSRTDAALRRTYGKSEEEIFRVAGP